VGFFILLLIILVGLFLGLGWIRYRENRFLKKRVKDALGREMAFEIERERKDALRRKGKFEDKLKKFGI